MILNFYRLFKERKQRAFINETITAWEPYMADGVFGSKAYEELFEWNESDLRRIKERSYRGNRGGG